MLLGARSWRCYPARGRQFFPQRDGPSWIPGLGYPGEGRRIERGGEFDSETGIPNRGRRSTALEPTTLSPTPHSGGLQGGSRAVERAGASESLRLRVGAPNERALKAGSQDAGSLES